MYEYLGSGTPVNNNGQGPASLPDNWRKVNSAPIMTDSLGRICVPETEIADVNKYYAIVETATYPEYDLPYNNSAAQQVFWAVQLAANTAISYPNWVHPFEFDKREFETASVANGNRFILKNRRPEIELYKENEEGKPMPSDAKQKVTFDVYRWVSTGTNPEASPYTWSQWEKIAVDTATAANGYFANIGKTGLKGTTKLDWYAIVEKSTYAGYEQPEGYWLIATGWNASSQKFEVLDVKYKVIQNNSAVDGVDPGHEVSDDKTKIYFTNKLRPISFIKEGGKKNPLGGVEFAFYKEKAGEAGVNGNEDPNAVDTKWDMANPTELTSHLETGEVNLGALTSGDYLLMETKTLSGYQLPLGYWIVSINFYGEIETIRGRGDPLPPAFRVAEGKYYLPNYLQTSLPKAGGYLRLFLVVLGIVLLGSGIILLQSRKK